MRDPVAVLVLTAVLLGCGWCQDGSLDQKVDLRAKGLLLPDLCKELTAQTGVKYKVARELAEERLIVMATDVRLGRIHDLVAALLLCRVSRNDASDGSVRYEFWRDAKTRERETLLVRKAWTKIAGEIESRTEKGEPSYDSDKAVGTPLLSILSEAGASTIYDLVEQKTLYLHYAGMSPTQRKSLLACYGELEGDLQQRMNEDEAEGFIPARKPPMPDDQIERSWVRFAISTDIFSGRCTLVPRFVGKFADWRMPLCDLWLREIACLPLRGCPYDPPEDGEEPADCLPKPEKAVEVPADAKWEDLLEMLHEAVGITIVSDQFMASFGYQVQPNPLPTRIACERNRSLDDAFDALCKATDRLWWESEGDCLFRTQLWYLRRLFEVPRSQLESWRSKLAKGGRLDRADIDQIAKLTARQVEGLASLSGQGAMWSSDDFYEALQVYASLDAAQRSAVVSGGLALGDLPAVRRDALVGLLASRSFSAPDADHDGLTLVLSQGLGDRRHMLRRMPAIKGGMAHGLSFWVDGGRRSEELGSIWIPYPVKKKPVGTFDPKTETWP